MPTPSDTLADATLAAMALDGNERAFTHLVQRHTSFVKRVLSRHVGNDPALDDLANTTMWLAHERLSTLRRPDRFRAFVAAIAVNVARNHRRSTNRRLWEVAASEKLAELPVIKSTRSHDSLTAAHDVLGQLDTDLRTCLSLRHLDGLELTEVANAVGVSLATVKRWLLKAERAFFAVARRDPRFAARVSPGAIS